MVALAIRFGASAVAVRLAAVIAILIALPACRRTNYCEKLKAEFNVPGFEPTDGEQCKKEVLGLQRLAEPFGSISSWKREVFEQSMLLLSIMTKVVDGARDTDSLVTFKRFPERPPCKDGVTISESDWEKSPLGQLGITRPSKLYYSFEVEKIAAKSQPTAPYVRFAAIHDFNCDGKVGTTTIEGVVHPGKPFFQNGFERTQTYSSGLISE